jgi:hypothetical protein
VAKTSFGGVVSDIRNKLGDVVYSRNRGGTYARAYVATNTSNTTPQANVRAAFKTIELAWTGTLTASQRADWSALADSLQPRPRPVNPSRRTGHNLYVGCAFQVYRAGAGILTDAPSDLNGYSVDGVPSATGSASGTTLDIQITNTPVGSQVALVWFTVPLRPAVNAFRHYLTRKNGIAPGDANPKNFWTSYIAHYPTPVAGSRIGYMVQGLNLLNGVVEPGYTGIITLAA